MTQKTRVLMLGWELPPYNSGGLGVACAGLTEALAKEGVLIDFVLPLFPEESAPSYMRVHSLLGKITPKEAKELLLDLRWSSPYMSADEYEKLVVRDPKVLMQGKSIYEVVKLYTHLAPALARKLSFDVIHAHDWLTYEAGLAISKESGKPLVTHVHATEFDRTGGNPDPRIADIEYRGLTEADRVVSVSEHTASVVNQAYAVNRNHIAVVHNGVSPHDDRRYKSLLVAGKSGTPLVLFVGRLTIQKGTEYFLRAAKRVLEYKPDVLFAISGSGDAEEKLMHEASELGIADKVFFVGFMRDDDLKQLYASADIYVMPSVSEPFGITALEAAQHGSTVIMSKQSGAKEVLRGSLVCDFWDTDEMAHLILSALKSKGLRQTLGEVAKSEAKGATWGKAAEKIIQTYRSLIKK
jgi:glycogen(starch) synthase